MKVLGSIKMYVILKQVYAVSKSFDSKKTIQDINKLNSHRMGFETSKKITRRFIDHSPVLLT